MTSMLAAQGQGVRGWWLAHTQRWGAGAAVFFFTAPAWTGLLGRLIKHGRWLHDWNALVCAGANAAAGKPIYGPAAACAHVRNTIYMYAPWIARGFAPAVRGLGITGADLVYAVPYTCACAFVAWFVYLRTVPGVDWRERVPLAAMVTASSIAGGNVAHVLNALILLAALTLPRARVLFVSAVAAAAAIKPAYAAFAIALLLEERPLRARSFTALWTGALCAGAALVSLGAADPDRAAWLGALQGEVFGKLYQSWGFFGWWTYAGLAPYLPAMGAAYVAYAALLVGAAWVIAEKGALGARARVMLGLGVGALLNPRLMDYDMMLMALAPFAAIVAARPLSSKLARALWNVALAAGVISLVFNLAGHLEAFGMHIATPLIPAIVIGAGAALALSPRRAS